MSNFGGPNSRFEKSYNAKFIKLNAKLKTLENQLVAILSNPSHVADAKILRTNAYWNAMRVQINQVYRDMDKAFAGWIKKELPLRYRQSLRNIQARIETTKGIANTAQKSITGMVKSTGTNQIVTGLVADANITYKQALLAGKNNVERFTRATQQVLVNERLVDATVAEAFNLGNLRKGAQALQNIIEGELLDGFAEHHFVQAGSRKFSPSYYAEMVTRTKFHDAQSIAALAQANNYDTDLVQVSSHNTKTPICLPFEAKIFSVSGKDKRFPPLTETSPYHPNCLHLMFPTFVES
ncbi:unnamed protein product, partial [marine sediment metagenome]